MGMWGEYVSVHERRLQAKKQMDKLKKKGKLIEPISLDGKVIAKEFWGKKWCAHIESFADYNNRLPRGRTYVRNGSVCHLGIVEGKIEAIVSGSSLYNVSVQIKTLSKGKWEAIKKQCSGMIGSILELLQGKIAKNIIEVVSDAKKGLFPLKNDISYSCSCPDWAGMCKHVAAVLYGIGSRFDQRPELLFCLRGVDPQELVAMPINLEQTNNDNLLESDNLADLFGIELEPNETFIENSKSKTPKTQKQKSSIDFDIITSNTITTLLDGSKLSVNDFAYELGVTPATVYRWKKTSGSLVLKKDPKDALIKLAKKYKKFC